MKPTFNEEVDILSAELAAILKKKNADYGDSYTNSVEKYGKTVTLIRLEDKLNRLHSLVDNKIQVTDEAEEDTLLDLAGYAILELVRRKMYESPGRKDM